MEEDIVALSAEDRLAILNLTARYNFAIDNGEADVWASTFTADGVFDSMMGTHSGTAELQAFAADFAVKMAGAEHWVSNQEINGDGETATHRCYLQLIKVESGESLGRAKYNDELVKVDGEWKFTKRIVR